MAFSTQKVFFFLPCMRSSKNYEGKNFCLQLREYNTIYDDRSWSLDEQEKSNFFKDIIRFRAGYFKEFITHSQDMTKEINYNVWNMNTVKKFLKYCINLIQAKISSIKKFIKSDLNKRNCLISEHDQHHKNETNFLIDFSKNLNLLFQKYNMDENEKESWRTIYENTRILFEQHQQLIYENKQLQFIINSTNKFPVNNFVENDSNNRHITVEHTPPKNSALKEICNTVQLSDDDSSIKNGVLEVKNPKKVKDYQDNEMYKLQKEKENLENEINSLKSQLRVSQFEAQKAESLQLENNRLCKILSELRDLEVECQNMKIVYNM